MALASGRHGARQHSTTSSPGVATRHFKPSFVSEFNSCVFRFLVMIGDLVLLWISDVRSVNSPALVFERVATCRLLACNDGNITFLGRLNQRSCKACKVGNKVTVKGSYLK